MAQLPPMEYVRLGKTGLKVSRVCLGCMSFGSPKWAEWVLDEEKSLPIIKRALDLGINFFDTANMYSNGESERVLGNALKKFNIPREQVVIATKVYFPVSKKDPGFSLFKGDKLPALEGTNNGGLSRKHIFEAVEDSLARLQTTYIDLYQIHRWDYNTPIEETMEALHDLVKAGKVRYIGASSMWAYQFAKAQYVAKQNGWTPFVSMQDLYNLIYREEEREMIPQCLDMGVGLIPWSPLARGVLSGRTTEDTTRSKSDTYLKVQNITLEEQDHQTVERLVELAKKKSEESNTIITPSQVALAWLYSKPVVSAPIVGTTKIEQLEDAVRSLQVKLTAEEIKHLEELYKSKPIFGHQ